MHRLKYSQINNKLAYVYGSWFFFEFGNTHKYYERVSPPRVQKYG